MMIDGDNDGQMIFGDLGGLKLPNICLTGEEKPRKNLTQETCPDWGSNPGPLHDRCACYRLAHSGHTSKLIGDGIKVSIFNCCNDATVITREVPLVHAYTINGLIAVG